MNSPESDHRRPHKASGKILDSDALGLQLHGQAPREVGHERLGGAVDGPAGVGLQRHARRHVDDGALALLLHARDDHAGHVDAGTAVDGENVFDLLRGVLRELDGLLGECAHVVHEDADVQVGDLLLNVRIDGRPVAEVGEDCHRLDAVS